MSKKISMEIKQMLDLNDPLSKTLLALGACQMFLKFLTNNMYSVDNAIQNIVCILITLYVLSCFRNGNCTKFAYVVSLFLILLFIFDIITMLSPPPPKSARREVITLG